MRRCQGCHYGQTLNCERQFVVLIPLAAPRLSYARRTASAIFVLERRLGILRYESRGRESGMIVEHMSKVAAAAGPLLLGSPLCLAPMCKCIAQPTVLGYTCARIYCYFLLQRRCVNYRYLSCKSHFTEEPFRFLVRF
jgi:hypothetical protein